VSSSMMQQHRIHIDLLNGQTNKMSAHLTLAERCTPTIQSMVTKIQYIALFDRAAADRHMYDGEV